jgi:2'-5' RNA ligase
MIRSFIAVEMPEQVRSEITKIIKSFAKDDFSVKWVKYENLHITLLFLGDTNNDFLNKGIELFTNIAKTEKSFEMSLQNIGAFPNQRSPRVIWIGVETGAQELTNLQEKIETAFTTIGHKPEARKFHPHLTIGRARDSMSNPERVFNTQYKSISFPIKSVVLFKSTLTPQGPIYEKLKEFPLVKS